MAPYNYNMAVNLIIIVWTCDKKESLNAGHHSFCQYYYVEQLIL